jgi:hypothetical protein
MEGEVQKNHAGTYTCSMVKQARTQRLDSSLGLPRRARASSGILGDSPRSSPYHWNEWTTGRSVRPEVLNVMVTFQSPGAAQAPHAHHQPSPGSRMHPTRNKDLVYRLQQAISGSPRVWPISMTQVAMRRLYSHWMQMVKISGS